MWVSTPLRLGHCTLFPKCSQEKQHLLGKLNRRDSFKAVQPVSSTRAPPGQASSHLMSEGLLMELKP